MNSAIVLNPKESVQNQHTKLFDRRFSGFQDRSNKLAGTFQIVQIVTPAREELETLVNKSEFDDAYNKWLSETSMISSAMKIIENEHFQRIIRMKAEAVPFILEKIRHQPSILVWALYFIFETEDEENLSIAEACKRWLEIWQKLQLK